MNTSILDLLLFAVLPYLALLLFFLMTVMRYVRQPFTYSSLSSQFLESSEHFWGLTALHYGIMVVLLGHLAGLLVPQQILLWNSRPLRLYVLEITGLAFALMALVGLLAIAHRRLAVSKIRVVTSFTDWVLLVLLILQVGFGIYVAVWHPWGSSWYAASAAPYLRSLFRFNPDTSYLITLPWMIKVHIVTGWLIVAVFPFTRLVHVLVAPVDRKSVV